MKLTRAQEAESQEAIEAIKKIAPEGSVIWTITKHVSRSGMLRSIQLIKLYEHDSGSPPPEVQEHEWEDNYRKRRIEPLNLSWLANKVLRWGWDDERRALKVSGTGMDTGFHAVEALSRAVYHDGYALEQHWL